MTIYYIFNYIENTIYNTNKLNQYLMSQSPKETPVQIIFAPKSGAIFK